MRSLRLGGLTVAVGVVVAALTAPATAGAGTAPPEPSFKAICNYTHSATNDPIVFPGQAGSSHLHDFFGSVATDESSTPDSLTLSETSCDFTEDHSAYWTPSLLQNGTPVAPHHVAAYYKVDGSDPTAVQPMPFGLVMITGDSHATAPQPIATVAWLCSPDSGAAEKGPTTATIPTCVAGDHLSLRLVYPQCWDGANLDSFDHKSHMAFLGKASTCPPDHPVLLPTLHQIVHFDGIQGGPEYSLSSGGQLTGHADFMNAWAPDLMERLVDTCLRQGQVCRSPSGPLSDGITVDTTPAAATAEVPAAPAPSTPVPDATVPTTAAPPETTTTLDSLPPATEPEGNGEHASVRTASDNPDGVPIAWVAGIIGVGVIMAAAVRRRIR